MKTIGLFYGSETGNTESVAAMVAAELGNQNVELHNISETDAETLASYDNLVIGTSTWGYGQLQGDWETFFPELDGLDLSGKTVALFGLGDQVNYADVFLDAMGSLYEKFKERGAMIIGHWPTTGYEFSGSTAVVDRDFVGLALDADNQDDLTPHRVTQWVSGISSQFQ
ncbi:flavodoxin [Prosthecochloris sp. GSB1]|uniref:flavodoxin n=1 Tax=Prosthecochloris sp. GSB1 TaxID=281093 RepID=UPI000B8C8D43|nr:flavodoxin [Prosthecochloris sp. GSB1]ASQ91018.1 flavodoxin [Prosthecochloris sp. GSB1]